MKDSARMKFRRERLKKVFSASIRVFPRPIPLSEALAAALLLAGAVLRILGYTASALWYDESIPLYRAGLPFQEMLTNRAEFSGNLLWEIILRPFVALSTAAWSLRLPALLLGCGTLWLAYRLMRRLEFRGVEMALASAFIAFLPGFIWIAQDAKQYALLSFLIVLAANFAADRRWLGLFAACGLMTYTHLVGPAYMLGPLAMALYLQPKDYKKLTLVGAGALLAWLPYLLWSMRLPLGDYPLAPLSLTGLFYSLGMLLWFGAIPQVGWAFSGLLLTFSLVVALFGKVRHQRAALLLLVAPFCAMLAESLVLRNVMAYRPLSGMIVPLGLVLGSSLVPPKSERQSPRKWANLRTVFLNAWKVVLAFGWVALLGWGLPGWDPAARGGHLDQAAETIRSQWQEGDVLYYATITVAMPFNYYLGDLPHYLLDADLNQFVNPPDVAGFESTPLDQVPHRRVWVIYPVADEIPPEVRQRLQAYTEGGTQVAVLEYPQMGETLVFLVP
jgi:hypothetical protein